MKITAYKCRFTGDIFESKFEFAEHLKSLRRSQYTFRKIAKMKCDINTAFKNMRDSVATIDDLEIFIKTHWNLFIQNGLFTDRCKQLDEFPELDEIKFTVKYSTCVSNTHSAPIGKVINWHCSNNLPHGYPGFSGKVEFKIKNRKLSSRIVDVGGGPFSVWRSTGINLGSGGGYYSSINKDEMLYNYEVKLFSADWVGLTTYFLLRNK